MVEAPPYQEKEEQQQPSVVAQATPLDIHGFNAQVLDRIRANAVPAEALDDDNDDEDCTIRNEEAGNEPRGRSKKLRIASMLLVLIAVIVVVVVSTLLLLRGQDAEDNNSSVYDDEWVNAGTTTTAPTRSPTDTVILAPPPPPPPNDNFQNATLIVRPMIASDNDPVCNNDDDSSQLSLVISGTLAGATPAQKAHDGAQLASCPISVPTTGRGVWYRLEGSNQVIRASTCQGTVLDTRLSVYAMTNSSLDHGNGDDSIVPYQCIVANDNACGFQSRVSWFSQIGQEYYILVHEAALNETKNHPNQRFFEENNSSSWAWDEEEDPNQSSFDFRITWGNLGTCQNSIGPLPTDGTLTVMSSVNASLSSSYTATGGTSCSMDAGYILWFWVLGTGQALEASLCHDQTEVSDTRLYVMQGSASCNSQECIHGNLNDNTCGQNPALSRAVWATERGETYRIAVSANYDWSLNMAPAGVFALSVTEVERAPNDQCSQTEIGEPLVVDGPPVITSTLNATFDDNLEEYCDGLPNGSPGVWYVVNGTDVAVEVRVVGNWTDPAATVTLYKGTCENLICIESRGQTESPLSIRFYAYLNDQYFIHIHAGSVTTNYGHGWLDSVQVSLASFEPISNDICQGATAPLEVNASSLVIVNAVGATDFGLFGCGGGRGLFYSVLGTGGIIEASTCNPATSFNNVDVFVARGDCRRLECVSATNTEWRTCDYKGATRWRSQENDVYYLYVYGDFNSRGLIGLTLREVPELEFDET